MVTVAELVFGEEFEALTQVAGLESWSIRLLGPVNLLLGVKAQDLSDFWVRCDADGYKATPPAWRWCDERGSQTDAPDRTPAAGKSNFFHAAGVICAPWNRLAYKTIDARGPHSDWSIGNWQANSYTGECKTLAAMATRIAIELRLRLNGRMGQVAR